MPAEQYGRWVSAVGTTAFAQDGSPAAALVLACAPARDQRDLQGRRAAEDLEELMRRYQQ